MNADAQYEVFRAKDKAYAKAFFGGVTSTGIFCRPGCPARLPKRENMVFFNTAEQALAAGFRACKRCHPAHAPEDIPGLVKKLIALVEDNPDVHWREADLKALSIDPSTARRQFQKRFGMSFSEYARARRLGRAAKTLSEGDSVINAQIDAGYASASGFRAAFAKSYGVTPKGFNPEPLLIDWIETPMGRMIAICDDTHLYMLEFIERTKMEDGFARLRRIHKRAVVPGRTPITEQIARELTAYFAGELSAFKTPLAPTGTDFQQATWRQLCEIPHGETRSYAQLAQMVGNPNAVRAVASANARNLLALIIPCHRVIASDGGLGGYAGGVDRKAKLLALEGARLA